MEHSVRKEEQDDRNRQRGEQKWERGEPRRPLRQAEENVQESGQKREGKASGYGGLSEVALSLSLHSPP